MNPFSFEFVTRHASSFAAMSCVGRLRGLALLGATSLLPFAEGWGQSWTNPDETWPPDEVTQNWQNSSNWSNPSGPVPDSLVYIQNGAGTSYVDTEFSFARLYLGSDAGDSKTRGVWVGDGGILNISAQLNIFTSGGTQVLRVDKGGKVLFDSAFSIGANSTPGSGTGGIVNEGIFTAALGG